MPKADFSDPEQDLAEFDIDLRENPRSSPRIWFENGGWIVPLILAAVVLVSVVVKDHVDLLAWMFLVPAMTMVMICLVTGSSVADRRSRIRQRHADGWQACGDCRGRGRIVEVDPRVPPFCEARFEDVQITVCSTCHGYLWVKTTGGIVDDDQGDPTS